MNDPREIRLVDWIMNVWDEMGEETTHEDIIQDMVEIVGNREQAEQIVEAWFKDHGNLLSIGIGMSPVDRMMAYEEAVKEWVHNILN